MLLLDLTTRYKTWSTGSNYRGHTSVTKVVLCSGTRLGGGGDVFGPGYIGGICLIIYYFHWIPLAKALIWSVDCLINIGSSPGRCFSRTVTVNQNCLVYDCIKSGNIVLYAPALMKSERTRIYTLKIYVNVWDNHLVLDSTHVSSASYITWKITSFAFFGTLYLYRVLFNWEFLENLKT